MNGSALAQILKRDARLFGQIVTWHLFPLRSAHKAKLEEHFGESLPLVRRLGERSRRYEKAFCRLVLRREGLEDDPLEDFRRPEAQFLLPDGAFLERLFFLVGLATYGKATAREIRGERVRKLLSTLGQANYRFALKEASFFPPWVALHDKLPEELDVFPQRCIEEGMAMFKSALGSVERGSSLRLRLKLSPSVGALWEGVEPSALRKDRAFILVRRVIKREGGER
ncbi:hypothetical protein TDMWS_20450 [Thermodesulfomicrobium sp. WS]|uniref:SctK family type III secretion system sorting platform protein n=1 Tax=Thermodesulfomicrobium sp. WS TaxID=3004129 RepID=UPI002491796C|nr:SctK family type III secretion system sorting platform protein [Thermodesulfomicrobium sp. WS]BDV01960.1 hypothetical protein TDMWS_20450 [Thermodesulfomicrobium sp. WS]